MTDSYVDNQGSKKKYLIPLVVLMICAVSLTGAAYAYNSSVTTTGNEFTSDAEILTIVPGEGRTVTKTLVFGVDYKSFVVNEVTKWKVDAEHSQLVDSFKLNLESSTGEAKDVTFSIGNASPDNEEVVGESGKIVIGGITFIVSIKVDTVTVDKNNDGTFTIEDMTADEQKNVEVTLVVDPESLDSNGYLVDDEGFIAPDPEVHEITFVINAVTEDIQHDEA